MNIRPVLLSSVGFIAFAMAAQAAPAPELIGKSLVLTWTENRQQKSDGRDELRAVSVNFSLGIYLSSAGRPFTRLTGSGRGGEATNEQVGAQGASLGGGVRSVIVNGHTVTLQANYGNYARNTRIEVAKDGGSCSAQMTIGKMSGSKPVAFRNTAGNVIEIHSVTLGSIACSVQAGNVFGR